MSIAKQLRALKNIEEIARRQKNETMFRGAQWQRKTWAFAQFAAKQLKVVNKAGHLVPFVLNDLQRRIWLAELQLRRLRIKPWILILKYRKGGVTTLQQGIAYHTIWGQPNAKCISLAHSPDDTREIFATVSLFYDEQQRQFRHTKTQATVMRLEFPEFGSVFRAESAGKTVGRGQTYARIHLSEAAFYRYMRELHSSLANSQRDDCAYILESTPNGRNGHGQKFYDYWQAAKSGKSPFTPLFFPWHGDPKNRITLIAPDELDDMSDEESMIRERFSLDLEQMKWWREKRLELSVEGRAATIIHQEHPCDDESCFLMGGESYFAPDLLDIAFNSTRRPLGGGDLKLDYGPRWNDIYDGFLRIWEEPVAGERYIIGVDPAEGVGRDATAICAINARTGEQAFSWSRNDMAPDVVASEIVCNVTHGLGWVWKTSKETPAYIVCERQNHGHAFHTGALKVARYPQKHVHHDIDQTSDTESRARKAGWNHNKVELTWALSSMLRNSFPKIRDIDAVASIQNVSEDAGQPKYSGRDLAVAVGLCVIGLRYLPAPPGRYGFLGGKVIDFEELRMLERKAEEYKQGDQEWEAVEYDQ